MNNNVTQSQLDSTRRELAGQHADLSERMTNNFNRVHERLDNIYGSRVKHYIAIIAAVITVVGGLTAFIYKRTEVVNTTLNSHLTESGKHINRIDNHDEKINDIKIDIGDLSLWSREHDKHHDNNHQPLVIRIESLERGMDRLEGYH